MSDWFKPPKEIAEKKNAENKNWFSPPSDVDPAKALKGVTRNTMEKESVFPSYGELVKSNIKADQLKQVIPSKTYDPNYQKSLDEIKNKINTAKAAAQKAKSDYDQSADWFASFKDDNENIVTDILDIGPSQFKKDYKSDYEKAAADYVSVKYNSEAEAEKELENLNFRLKTVKNTEKQEIKNEIDILRTGLYGKYSLGEHVWANFDTGTAQFNKSLSATADFLVGNVLKAFGWKDNPITKWDNWHQKQLEASSLNSQQSAKSIGDKSNISGQVIQGVTGALPDAAIAVITLGASEIPNAINAVSKAPGILGMMKTAITTTAKNPNYWLSFARELGTSYQQAKASGASENEATLYALLSSTVNSVVEVGGGIQTLPKSLQGAYKSGKLLEWFKSTLEEGGEEVIQSIISGLTEKTVYNPEKEVFSTTNENAVINPSSLLKQGAMGSAVGAILGGGQLSIDTILNVKNESDYKNLGTAVLTDKNIDIQGVLDYSRKSLDSGIRQLAVVTNTENVSNRTAGILYQYVVSDIKTAINSPANIETATVNFSNIIEGTDSEIIKSIASSQYVLKLMDEGIEKDDAQTQTQAIIAQPTEQNPQLQSNANQATREEGRGETLFRDAPKKEIAQVPDMVEIGVAALNRTQPRNSVQMHVDQVAKKLGVNVVWDNKVSMGKYNVKTKTITMNPNITVSQAYITVFKHEFTHFLESKKGYTEFNEYLFSESKAFGSYCLSKCEELNLTTDGTRQSAIDKLVQHVYAQYRNSNEIAPYIRNSFTMDNAKQEVVAEFVGKSLFGGTKSDLSLSMLTELAENHRSLFERIMDWVKEKISQLRGDPQNRSVLEDLEYLNKKLRQVYESKNKKTATESDGVKYSITFSDEKSVSQSKEVIQMIDDNVDKISKTIVFDVKDATQVADFNKKSEYVLDMFNRQGNIAYNSEIGNVELIKSGAKSTIMHGFGKEKLTAVEAIKPVIENGNIIDYTKNYNGTGVDRYVIAAKGKLNGLESYVGVVVKSYPNAKSNSKFYLHEAEIIKADSSVMTAPQLSVDTVDKSAFDNNVSHNDPSVNTYSMQGDENNSDKSYIAITPADKLLEAYDNGEISREEYLKQVKQSEVRLSTEYEQYIQELNQKYEDRRDKELQGYTKKISQQQKRIVRQNEQLAKRRSEVNQEITAAREERASKQKNIEHIRRVVGSIDKTLRTNSEKKHVPEELQNVIRKFCSIFLQNDRSVFKKEELAYIHMVYSEMQGDYTSGGETLLGTYDFDIDQQIANLAHSLDGKTLRDLDNNNLLAVRDIVDNFQYMITNENKLFINGKSFDIDEISIDVSSDLSAIKTKRELLIGNKVEKTVFESNTTPIYFFKKLGNTFYRLFQDVVKGQDKWTVNMETAHTFIRQAKEKYHYDSWEDETLKLTTVHGDEIELNREQAMLLYATAKREKLNKLQMAEHLYIGGIVLEPDKKIKTLNDALNKLKNTDKKGKQKLIEAFTQEINSDSHQIDPRDVGEVNLWLTDEQKAYADEMVKYLSNDMAALGNETSMQMFGIRKFNESYYIPYNSAPNYLYSQPGVGAEVRIKHQSFTKQTQKKANNPLLLTDFSTVCANHINHMCMYNAMTVPLENMNRVFNYKTIGKEGSAPKSIKAELQRAYGRASVAYLDKFIEHMNGNVRTSGTDTEMGKWISRFKKGAVFASASVVVQQPSAIGRAFALVDPKYFVQTSLKLAERSYEQLKQYAPVAILKEMGRFDTGTGISNTEWLLRTNPNGIKEKAKALVLDSSYRDDKLSYFAAKADEITWGHIWAAVKAETAATTKLEVGSEEFLKAAGERFTEVINLTQVYDSTLSKSENMRNKTAAAQMLTAFMSEPTVSLNLLMDAKRQAKTGGTEGKKYAARAIGAFVSSVLLNAMLKSLVTAGRDDDKEKSYLEKYIGNVAENATSDLFVPNLIPFVKDIVSVFKGYTVERADMNLFSDLAQSVEYSMNENNSTAEKIKKLAGSISAFFGIPLKNVLRDINTVQNMIDDIFVNENKTDAKGVKYSILENLGLKDTLSKNYERLYEAAEEEDEKKYQEIYNHLIEKGKTDSQIYSGLKSAYKNSEDVQNQASEYTDMLSDNKTYKAFDSEDQDNIKKDITDEIATEQLVRSTDKKADKYDELYEAYRKGGNSLRYKQLRQELIDAGKTESQIEDGMEIAKFAYMKSIGIDIHEYILFKYGTKAKYADKDGSGGVSSAEKKKAISDMDLDSKTKSALINFSK